MKSEIEYCSEPKNKQEFTESFNEFYSRFAQAYGVALKIFPVWRRWISTVIPHIQGPRVLEVSFGTGDLFKKFASRFEAYGIDYNEEFVRRLREGLTHEGIPGEIQQGDVQALPYKDNYLDSIVNTMAFSAYPDGMKAMSEMHRVLKPGGKLIMVDIEYPKDRNWMGMKVTKAWISMGDIIREMGPIFEKFDFVYTDEEVGGFGSVHLYVAEKQGAINGQK